ncbi:MAG: aryl-sulfate sulfotransferase [Ignavibacteria bacterium]|nr:aryl-sulfate sulfotransferase [Ignavibacteria bacterium]
MSNNPSAGPIFINNFQTPNYAPHIIIANNDGTPFYYREFVGNAPEFKRQPNGLITYFSFSKGKYYAEDSDFNIVDSFYCGNGYSTDNHELKILNSGNALLMSYDRQPVDMSLLVAGGNPNATVIGLIIQEIDVNKNVVFQWRSWDHYEILDAYHVNFTLATVDAVHGNSIELDNDGTLLISARHLNEVTKISRQTGEMVWRMGGVNNEFTFLNDTIPFIYQHDVRRIANGNITLYDNGNFRTPVLFSRAVEYQVDEVNKTVNLIWQYRNNPDIHGPNRGSVQRLKNGNTLIGWGGTNPTLSEVTPAGNVVLEMSLPQSVYSYRAFRDEATFTLNVKLAIEGFYNSQSNTLNMKDTVRAYIRSSNTPYNIIDSAKSIVDSVNMTGNFQYYNISAGTYYISTKHRNGLETWSKAGGESFTSGGVYLYDFTVSDLSAFGNNLMLKGSKYCIYSGDINQDENIDLTDVITIANDAASFVTGYVNTDVNGDNISDLTDVLITFNNSSGFVSVIRP